MDVCGCGCQVRSCAVVFFLIAVAVHIASTSNGLGSRALTRIILSSSSSPSSRATRCGAKWAIPTWDPTIPTSPTYDRVVRRIRDFFF